MCKRHVFALIHSCCLQVSDFVAEHYVQNGYRYRAVFKHENMAKHRRNPASRWKEAVDSGRKCSSMTSKPPRFMSHAPLHTFGDLISLGSLTLHADATREGELMAEPSMSWM
mmetsp:Transcript_36787/g.92482  ORF Transcript_36787/g.92482 Transcript_36787/m.92482 type:complete len:112 (+) Transcript_36787:565-900(+)